MHSCATLCFAVFFDFKVFCISLQGIIRWKQSRKFFYWRLRRLILQDEVKRRCRDVNPDLSSNQIDVMLRRWFVEDKGTVQVGWFLGFVERRSPSPGLSRPRVCLATAARAISGQAGRASAVETLHLARFPLGSN